MVVSPGKLHGVKLNVHRVDPPAPMTDPLLSWATKRLRLQGNIKKLHKEKKRSRLALLRIRKRGRLFRKLDFDLVDDYLSVSPPPAPIVMKKSRRRVLLEEEEVHVKVGIMKLIRKLKDDFDLVVDDFDLLW